MKPYSTGNLYSFRTSVYSIVVAAKSEALARVAFAEWLGERMGIVPDVTTLPYGRATQSLNNRPLIISEV